MTLQDRDAVVIVGAGQAGAELAFSLRRQGCRASIVLIGEEPHWPYQRPPLSKGCLHGELSNTSLELRARDAYERAGIRLLMHTRAAAIDRAACVVRLEDGRELEYTRLALATGATPRRSRISGTKEAEEAGHLQYLRTIDDVQRIRKRLLPGKRVAIIGGGFLGLEIAASLRAMNVGVTVIEGAPRVLARVAGLRISTFYEALHRAAGVDVRTNVVVAGIDLKRAAGVVEVHGADGFSVTADLVIAAVGVVPNTQLAQAAGLHVDDGIVVDERMRASDPAVVAIGDCASCPSPFTGRRTRLESVPAALAQAKCAAATLMNVSPPAAAVPWFWSDQYELKLQMCGATAGHTEVVVRGEPSRYSFTVFYLREGRVLASESVCRPQDFMVARKFIASGEIVQPQVLCDEAVSLSAVVPRVAVGT